MKQKKRVLAAALAVWLLCTAFPFQIAAAEFAAVDTVENADPENIADAVENADTENIADAVENADSDQDENLPNGDTFSLSIPERPEDFVGKTEIDQAAQVFDLAAIKTYLFQQFAACKKTINLRSFNIPRDNSDAFFNMLYYDMPEAYHVEVQDLTGVQVGAQEKILADLFVDYTLTPDEYAAQLNLCRQKASQILSGIKGNDDLTDVQKALLIHDRLALQVVYPILDKVTGIDETTGEQVEIVIYPEGKSHYDFATIYSCLVSGEAVCQGYAFTYGYLLDQVGIENYYVNSKLLSHAWNLIYIDNTPFFVDVTWDDPTNDIYGRVEHNNFLLSTGALAATGHQSGGTVDYETLPQDTRYDDAFWKCSNAAFQLIGNDIYYVDHENAVIRRWGSGDCPEETDEEMIDVSASWPAGDNAYWPGNYTRLGARDGKLFYSTPREVRSLDPETHKTALEYSLENDPEYLSIFGFKFEGAALKVQRDTSPNAPYLIAAPTALSVLDSDEAAALTVKAVPDDETYQTLDWRVADSGVVSLQITEGGEALVTPLKQGSTVITVTAKSGVSVTIPVKVICTHALCHREGARPATPTEEGYSGDLICDACNLMITPGYPLYYVEEPANGEEKTWLMDSQEPLPFAVSVFDGSILENIVLLLKSGDEYITLPVLDGDFLFEDSVLSLKVEYLKTLASGRYVLQASFGAGVAETDFTVLRYGDANGDGAVNTADIIRLKNHLAGVSDAFVGLGADLNGDGVITTADITRLKNYLANLNFATGKSSVKLGK